MELLLYWHQSFFSNSFPVSKKFHRAPRIQFKTDVTQLFKAVIILFIPLSLSFSLRNFCTSIVIKCQSINNYFNAITILQQTRNNSFQASQVLLHCL